MKWPPTKYQIEYIESLGFELDTKYIKTQKEANDIIEELLATSGHTFESEKLLEQTEYNKTVYKTAHSRVREAMSEKWLETADIRAIAKNTCEEYPSVTYFNLAIFVSNCRLWQQENSKFKTLSA